MDDSLHLDGSFVVASMERRRLKVFPLLILLGLGKEAKDEVGRKHIYTGFTVMQSIARALSNLHLKPYES